MSGAGTVFDVVLGRDNLGRDSGAADVMGAAREGMEWMSAEEVVRVVQAFAQALTANDIGEGQSATVATLGVARKELTCVGLAASLHARRYAPISASVDPERLLSSLNAVGANVVVADSAGQVERLLVAKRTGAASLKLLIQVEGEIGESQRTAAEAVGLSLYPWDELVELGDTPPHTHAIPNPDDVHYLLLQPAPHPPLSVTHRRLMSLVDGLDSYFSGLTPNSVLLSFVGDTSLGSIVVTLAVLKHKLRIAIAGEAKGELVRTLAPVAVFARPQDVGQMASVKGLRLLLLDGAPEPATAALASKLAHCVHPLSAHS